jgi:hypothetical protein
MIPWVNYDVTPLLEAREKKRERNQQLLISAATMGMNMKEQAAKNLLGQQELAQRGAESQAKLGLEQQQLGFHQKQYDDKQLMDSAYGLSKIKNMMTPSHPDYNPEGAKALAKALGFDIGADQGTMDQDALLPMGGR